MLEKGDRAAKATFGGAPTTIVYILTNPAMPGLIKIGQTDGDVEARVGQLYTTGVPVPFNCYYACRLDAAKGWERRLHKAFEIMRVNPKREFFEMEAEQAKAILMRQRAIGEPEAYSFLREQAMRRRVPVGVIASAVVELNEVLSEKKK
jgi:hypothetical protein